MQQRYAGKVAIVLAATDPQSMGGTIARRLIAEGAKVIRKRLSLLAGGRSVILTGDFNDGPEGDANTCVRAAVEPMLAKMEGVNDSFATQATLTIR